MSLATLLLLVTVVLHHCVAAPVHFVSAPQEEVSKRAYSQHWRLANPVKNCTETRWTMKELNTTASISAADCQQVLENARFNKGYYEVWSFDSDAYTPITGFRSCVFAVARTSMVIPGDYAVIGNDDVVTAVAQALGNHSSGNVSGAAGVWDCGPSAASLQLLIYDGLKGYSDNRTAAAVYMAGDWAPTALESVGAPTVTSIPTETPGTYGNQSSHRRGDSRQF